MKANQLPELAEKIANRREEAGRFRSADLRSRGSSNLYCSSKGYESPNGKEHDGDALHGGQSGGGKTWQFFPYLLRMAPSHAQPAVSSGWLLGLARALVLVVCLRLPVVP